MKSSLRKEDRNIIIRVISFINPYKLHFIVAIILMLLTTLIGAVQPMIFGKLVDLISANNYKYITSIIILMFMLFAFSLFFGILMKKILINISLKIETGLCTNMFSNILNQTLAEFHSEIQGGYITRLEEDVRAFSNLLTNKLFIIVDLISALIVGSLLLYINWQMALVTLISFPITFSILTKAGKKIRNEERLLKENKDKYYNFLNEVLNGMKTIKILTAELEIIEKYVSKISKLYKIGINKIYISMYADNIVQIVNYLFYLIVLILSITFIIRGNLTIGGLVAFNMYSKMFLASLQKLSGVNSQLYEMVVSFKRVFELLDKSKINEVQYDIVNEKTFIEDDVILSNINFSYGNSEAVLKNVSLSIKKGELTTISGNSGSGKTTLCNLIAGIYLPTKGEIRIGNHIINECSRKVVYSQISYITQDFFFFEGTIYESLMLGNKSTNEQMVIEACKAVNMHEEIMNLPLGYNTVIKQKGQDLSIGQKQRLNIARGLLRNASVYLFDEVTSALDQDNEKLIDNLIKQIAIANTVIAITHKKPILNLADSKYIIKDSTVYRY